MDLGHRRLLQTAAALCCGLWLVAAVAAAPFEFLQPNILEKHVASDIPSPPKLPKSYTAKYTFTLPYTAVVQPDPVSYDVTLYYDNKNGRIRVDSYDGVDSSVQLSDDVYFEVVPSIDHIECMLYNYSDNEEHRQTLVGDGALPDPSTWKYAGIATVKGKKANMWMLTEFTYGQVQYYRFYFDEAGTPLRLSMIGQDIFSGSHYDEYIVDFLSFTPGVPDDSVFAIPNACNDDNIIKQHGMSPLALQVKQIIPRVIAGDAEYDAFIRQHGRFHSSPPEYRMRLGVYYRNRKYIDEWNNKEGVTHTLAVNKFADWTDDEYKATMLGRRGDSEVLKASKARAAVHRKQLPEGALPKTVDWEGTGENGVVKDQANCGSCWAFGASGAMEAAWFMETGEQLSFSEQQLVDCSWNQGNYACDGGWPEAGIDYVVDNGGIATGTLYEYLGQDGWCRDNSTTKSGFFTGYVNIPFRDANATKEAVYLKGPLAVSIDANHLGFRFYSSGVLTVPDCGFLPMDLDHSVMLVGYGIEDGKNYWRIRNSWSAYWGDSGYIKIDMKYDCGVTTDALYAVVDKEKLAEQHANNK